MYKRTLVLSALFTLAFSGASFAAEADKSPRDLNKDGKTTKSENKEAKHDLAARFKAADKDNDGGLSRQELKGIKEFEGIEKNFDQMDANKDGKVTFSERNNWLKAQGKEKAQKEAKQEKK
jgi:Ca2+-binding EF-hand superfamily protein